MGWDLDFISEEDFKKHVQETIMKYGEKLKSYDLKRFNSNLIDPIKLIFDKSIYKTSWEEIVNNEIFRQRDKSNNNDIGYFHQNIFSHFKGCEIPQEGWDVIYRNPDGIQMPDGDLVHTIYVEMKNKHNTMNSASSAKTYIKMHKLIRRVSMDQFYWILTGDKNAFYKVCMKLPEVINSVINEESGVTVPNDTVIEELRRLSLLYEEQPEDLAMAMAVYMLGFSTYMGFANRIEQKLDCGDEKKIKRIYEYVKKVR